ncbi:MAG: transcriptional regulator [Dehalococcoidia bacterium]
MNPQRRSVRLAKILELLRGRKAGYTARELADITGRNIRTIQRDINVLQSEMGEPLMEDRGRYALLREERLSPLELTLQQARALFIATRLFLRYSDEGDPFAAEALRKVAQIMPQRVRELVRAAAETVASRSFDAEFARHMTTVTEAWSRQRVLKLSYRSAGRQRPREVIVEPYFIEPSAAGFATYLIAYSRTHESMRTFKVERIVSAEMLPQAFAVPDDFDIDALLSSAWGIIWGEGKTVELQFSPDVAWRVRETRWHPTQSVEDLPGGGVLLTMTVAGMMEVGRWVRSWGDKCQVLAPPELRAELREEALRLARQYASPARPAPRKRTTSRQPAAASKGQARLGA